MLLTQPLQPLQDVLTPLSDAVDTPVLTPLSGAVDTAVAEPLQQTAAVTAVTADSDLTPTPLNECV